MVTSAVEARWLGRKFGRLLITTVRSEGPHTYVDCDCDCGGKHSCRAYYLPAGNTNSCGCLRREKSIALRTTHGKTNTRSYRIWHDMKRRCDNPKNAAYKHYGARGIFVSDEWSDFARFAIDMGEPPSAKHELDRIDNDGPYSKDNCRWATRSTQMRNTRRALYVAFGGRRLHLKEWATETGIKYTTLRFRLKSGLSPEAILTKSGDRSR